MLPIARFMIIKSTRMDTSSKLVWWLIIASFIDINNDENEIQYMEEQYIAIANCLYRCSMNDLFQYIYYFITLLIHIQNYISSILFLNDENEYQNASKSLYASYYHPLLSFSSGRSIDFESLFEKYMPVKEVYSIKANNYIVFKLINNPNKQLFTYIHLLIDYVHQYILSIFRILQTTIIDQKNHHIDQQDLFKFNELCLFVYLNEYQWKPVYIHIILMIA